MSNRAWQPKAITCHHASTACKQNMLSAAATSLYRGLTLLPSPEDDRFDWTPAAPTSWKDIQHHLSIVSENGHPKFLYIWAFFLTSRIRVKIHENVIHAAALWQRDLEMLDDMEVDPMISAAPQFLPDFPWDNLSKTGTKCFKDSSYGTSCVLCVMAVGAPELKIRCILPVVLSVPTRLCYLCLNFAGLSWKNRISRSWIHLIHMAFFSNPGLPHDRKSQEQRQPQDVSFPPLFWWVWPLATSQRLPGTVWNPHGSQRTERVRVKVSHFPQMIEPARTQHGRWVQGKAIDELPLVPEAGIKAAHTCYIAFSFLGFVQNGKPQKSNNFWRNTLKTIHWHWRCLKTYSWHNSPCAAHFPLNQGPRFRWHISKARRSMRHLTTFINSSGVRGMGGRQQTQL